jgi:hypothetical protein
MWIGTNKGLIGYIPGKSKTDKDGRKVEGIPTWKTFHSKNGLKGNVVISASSFGKDLWVATEEAVNQYDRGDIQTLVFYEPLLPAFKLPDLWHVYLTGVMPTDDWGTIGITLNYLNFGENDRTNELGQTEGKFKSNESVFALSYGIPLSDDFSIGLNIKYALSRLAPGGDNSEGIGQTFAIDAGILKRNFIIKNLSLGFMMQNMGPPIFYIDPKESDPIPFTLRLGMSYTIVQTPVHDLKIAGDLDREIVKNYLDSPPDPFWKAIYTDLNSDKPSVELREIIEHIGIEYWYVNFLALRAGLMHDAAGSRDEVSLGIGLKYGNLGVDWSYIHSPKGSEARNGQWRLSILSKF